MPFRWCSGKTETGPSPYQLGVPSEMVTGEKAICPITRPSISATRDTARAPAARSASTMKCSVWLLISKVLNAAIVTSVIAQISSRDSFLIMIFGFMLSYSTFFQSNATGQTRSGNRVLRQRLQLIEKVQSLSYELLNRDIKSLGKFHCDLLADRPYAILHI